MTTEYLIQIYTYIYMNSAFSLSKVRVYCAGTRLSNEYVCLYLGWWGGIKQTNKQKKKTAQFLMLFLLRLLYGYALGTENCSLTDTFLVLLNVLKPFVF